MINLTPHDIHVRYLAHNGEREALYTATGDVARVTVDQKFMEHQDGIPVRKNTYGDVMVGGVKIEDFVRDLWEPILVSQIVLDALRNMGWSKGAYAPDTGPTAVRNDKGHIEYVTGVIGL